MHKRENFHIKDPKKFVEDEFRKNLAPTMKKELRSTLKFVILFGFIPLLALFFEDPHVFLSIISIYIIIVAFILLRLIALLIFKPKFREEFLNYISLNDDN